jgi:tetratricopeptide (TPR) repeat protein
MFSFAQENLNATVSKDSINSYPDSLILDEIPTATSQPCVKKEENVKNDENDKLYEAEKQEIKMKNASNSQIYNITLKSQKSQPKDTLSSIKRNIYIKNYSQAEDSMDRLISGNNLNALDMAEIASCYDIMRKPHKAFFAYERALAKQPNRIEILYNYSLSLHKSRYYNKACYNLNKIIKINPDFMLAHYELANIYHEKGDYLNALRHYVISARINPMSSDTFYNIGSTLESMNYHKLALKYYTKCLNINPMDKQAAEALLKLENG